VVIKKWKGVIILGSREKSNRNGDITRGGPSIRGGNYIVHTFMYTLILCILLTGSMEQHSALGEYMAKLQQPSHQLPPEVQRHAPPAQQLHHPAGAAQPPTNAPQPKESETYQGLDLGSGYKQCSVSRGAANTRLVPVIQSRKSAKFRFRHRPQLVRYSPTLLCTIALARTFFTEWTARRL
jgi:hypothetical protein